MAIDPIIRSGYTGQPIIVGRKPIHRDMHGNVIGIGSDPIVRSGYTGQPVSHGGKPVPYSPGTPTSDEVGGLPVINGLDGRPSAVVTPSPTPPPPGDLRPPTHWSADLRSQVGHLLGDLRMDGIPAEHLHKYEQMLYSGEIEVKEDFYRPNRPQG